MVRALLLAAGLGTRLRPLTDRWPKCLMPIGKRPLLDYWLQTLSLLEIKDVLVNTHFQASKVKTFLSCKKFSSWVSVVHEAQLLGTAGTLRANINFFRGHTTLLVHADNWCQCNFGDFINYHVNERPSHCLITMMTFDTDAPKSCGIVETDDFGVVVAFHEKVESPPGRRANAAVYLIEPEILGWLESNPHVTDFSTEVLPCFVGRIGTWHNTSIHRDIGTILALRAAQRDPSPNHCWPTEDDWQINFEASAIFSFLMSHILTLEDSNE